MFGTAMRQLGYAWTMMSGRRFRIRDVRALVDDTRATMEAFGSPGEGSDDMLAAADPEIQEDLTKRRLRRTMKHALAEVPYYRRLGEPGMALADLPPTPKQALRGMPAAFVSDRARPAVLAHTTGTTGSPTLVWFSAYEVELMSSMAALALMLTGGVREEHLWANAISSRSIAQVVAERAVPMTGAGFVHLGMIDPRTALDRLATPLHVPGKRPLISHVNVTASYLAALVQEAERSGWSPRDFGLIEVWSGGEVLTDALRVRAEEVLGAKVFDGYSMTEIAPVTGQVCDDGHLHLPADQGLVEVLDPVTLEPAAPDTTGVLVITPYSSFRDTTLLLRYVTGDLVKTLPESAPATCAMAAIPATSRVLGRLTGTDGLTTRDVLDLLQGERALPLPTRYAVEDDVLFVVSGKDDPTLLSRLEERATGLPIKGIALVETPDDLPTPCQVRADLIEHSFEHAAPVPLGVR
ncbi:phenylacetate-coenzyme A ligase PaaK-like adenylate-forming protein [Nonomuraea fuscirosea]|uniref:Phenylacetate-coenzyme A ligase PaaK-like adenylate-forming protein n=1 Tax=Nonomuraea fuscirosea TaxID=1291556 RepID=A0A2T0MLR0_9ACTN|nr:AMP-binding protein [Nonomuraea fuscirosea]PRX58627.1 phenylacetate-coenzyme A ligase PaaK-like adenylate-forming protein [Nonomuraea fuscirosea]